VNAVTYSLFGLQVPFAPDFESTVDQFEQNFLATQTSGFSAALNAEKLYMAQKDASVFNLLSAASFRYLDGIGAVWAARRKYNLPFARVPGVELWLQIAKRAARRGLKIAIIGGTEETCQKAVEVLREQHGIDVAYARNGYFDSSERATIAQALKAHDIRFAVIAMGSPRQEKFSQDMIEAGVNAFFFGVGGSLDVLTGKVDRAPRIFRDNGLEWLHRLLRQPSRIGRQLALAPYFLSVLRAKM
jgi:UDP-N-acetyl-D-mannosaminouronate:lipid I N-acetyl-D-mannosaminouronosyltransferase